MSVFIIVCSLSILVFLSIAMIGLHTTPKPKRSQLPRKIPGYEFIPGGRTGKYRKKYTFEDKLTEEIRQKKALARQLQKVNAEDKKS